MGKFGVPVVKVGSCVESWFPCGALKWLEQRALRLSLLLYFAFYVRLLRVLDGGFVDPVGKISSFVLILADYLCVCAQECQPAGCGGFMEEGVENLQ